MTTTDREELFELFEALCEGIITPVQHRRLQQRLGADAQTRQFYFDYLDLRLQLRQWQQASLGERLLGMAAADDAPPAPILTQSPPLHAPVSTYSPIGSFAFSYLVAALIVGVGLLIGWVYHVPNPRAAGPALAKVAPPPAPGTLPSPRAIVVVGRVTATADCRWVDPKMRVAPYSYVPLDAKYMLVSGLLEITYDSGAKVIVQGPCIYQVDSRVGGYLSQGRLTARVEKRGETAIVAANQQLATGDPRSSSRFFTVRTPTAKVVDLGTQFCVEVDSAGVSMAHVCQGKVEVLAVGRNGAAGAKPIRLEKGESARVEVGKDQVARVVRQSGQPGPFVLQMPKRVRIKMFNTGVNLDVGQRDPHWQLVARSDNPRVTPLAAVVTDASPNPWLANQRDRSQWLTTVASTPNGVVFTFRTTFDLKGMRPSSAVLRGRFVADNHVSAIRLNGRDVSVPEHSYEDFSFLRSFSSNHGFVEGLNVLEIDVENLSPGANAPSHFNPMGLLVELEGSAMSAWPEPSANLPPSKPKQKDSNN